MKIKCYYRRNLKMSPEKLSAQVGHVCKELGRMVPSSEESDVIIVLKASDAKFELYKQECAEGLHGECWYLQKDLGFTEVDAGTETVIGWIEE